MIARASDEDQTIATSGSQMQHDADLRVRQSMIG